MNNAPNKIHLITAAYQSFWTIDGTLHAVHKRSGSTNRRTPSGVGWREQFWGESDAELNQACEEACWPLENQIPRLLSQMEDAWPLGESDRALLTEFLALHIVRTVAFKEWLSHITSEVFLRQYKDSLTFAQYERFLEKVRSNHWQAEFILGTVNEMSTIVGFMHWTLIRFDEPLLITCDQPVAPVPRLERGENSGLSAIPPRGWLDTIEVRCPLTPHLALLGTWVDGFESNPVEGTWAHAVNLNGVLCQQADRHWIHRPDRLPPMPLKTLRRPQEVFEPIAPSILRGYDNAAVLASKRRLCALRELDRLIEENNQSLTLLIPELIEAA